MFKLLGLIPLVISWVTGAYVIFWYRADRSKSISQHATQTSATLRFFGALLILTGITFYTWLLYWFIPTLRLPSIFTVIATIVAILTVIAAIVPDTYGWNSKIHRAAAYGVALLLLPLSFIVSTRLHYNSVALTIVLLCMTYMISACIGFWLVKHARRHYLFFQSLYIVAFQLIIITAAYVR